VLHKLREAMGAAIGADELEGEVEIDGAFFGGHTGLRTEKLIVGNGVPGARMSLSPASAGSVRRSRGSYHARAKRSRRSGEP
jgi:hypothetical protein